LNVPFHQLRLTYQYQLIYIASFVWISIERFRDEPKTHHLSPLDAAWIYEMLRTVALGFVLSFYIPSVHYLRSRRNIKGSIVGLYFRLVEDLTSKFYSRILRCVAVLILLFTISIVVVSLPSSYSNSQADLTSTKAIAMILGDRKTVNTSPLIIIHTTLQGIFNASLALLPVKPLYDLKLGLRHKIPLVFILVFGFLTIVPTICGGVYRHSALTGLKFSLSSLNWARVELATSIEINAGLICSSFPAWRKFGQALGNKWFKKQDRIMHIYSTGAGCAERREEQSGLELGVTGSATKLVGDN
jgi:hypothetical protein